MKEQQTTETEKTTENSETEAYDSVELYEQEVWDEAIRAYNDYLFTISR